jgi:hypothetical protein
MIQPWQINFLNKMQGIKPGKMSMITAGRHSGKSMLSSQAFQRLWEDMGQRPIEELKLSEGRVHGARYYCVEPIGGNWRDMETWCLDAYGDCGSVWDLVKAPEPNARWYMNDRRVWFREEKDRLMFILKWR